MGHWLFDILGVLALGLVCFLVILILIEPGLHYRISPREISIDSAEFLRLLVRCAMPRCALVILSKF